MCFSGDAVATFGSGEKTSVTSYESLAGTNSTMSSINLAPGISSTGPAILYYIHVPANTGSTIHITWVSGLTTLPTVDSKAGHTGLNLIPLFGKNSEVAMEEGEGVWD